MRYSLNNYVDAFTQAIAGVSNLEREKLTANFAKVLKKTGDIRNAKKILEAIHKKLVNQAGGKWVNIETAREVSGSKKENLKKQFSQKDYVFFNINPELIAGIRVTVNGEEELDNTLNYKLNKLFK
jgi:F0F1-type ATP synthase delta subunit